MIIITVFLIINHVNLWEKGFNIKSLVHQALKEERYENSWNAMLWLVTRCALFQMIISGSFPALCYLVLNNPVWVSVSWLQICLHNRLISIYFQFKSFWIFIIWLEQQRLYSFLQAHMAMVEGGPWNSWNIPRWLCSTIIDYS